MNRSDVVPKKDFIGKAAPPGYVAGIGRGATGFTTRSDIGPARETTRPSGSGFGGAGHSSRAHPRDNDEDEESEYLNEANYDEFAGYKGSLFNKEDPYDEDDKEADKIYEGFDLHMNERGKAREREQALKLETVRYKRPRIQQQFTDLTEDLKQVTEAEWINLPESGDARNRKQRVGKIDKYTPIPESLLAEQSRIASGGETLVSIDPRTSNHPDIEMKDDEDDEHYTIALKNRLLTMSNTIKNQAGSSTAQLVNIGDMNECRSSIISTTLSRASKTVGIGQLTATNREAYLSQLASTSQVKVDDNIEDRRRQYQMMLKTTDLDLKTKVYIMYVDLEDKAGKLSNARALARKACEECPTSVELWLENIRLNPRQIAKKIMIEAIKARPTSVKLWLKAAEIESSELNKLKIYKKASEAVPNQPEIWRKWAESEPETLERDAILEQAVKSCPEAIDMWLSLARIKPDMKSASEVLRRASNHNSTNRSIRIELAKLYERSNDGDNVKEAIAKVVSDFKNRGVDIVRDDWFKDAIEAEHEGFPVTAAAIVRRLLGWDLGHFERDQHKLLEFLFEDANKFAKQNSPSCAREIYRCIVNSFRAGKEASSQLKENAWITWAKFEEKLGPDNVDKLEQVLIEATSRPENCQSSETLWSMLIEMKQNDPSSSDLIQRSLESNPRSEAITLAAVDFFCKKSATKDARRILANACMANESANLIMRHAELERSLGNLDEAVRLLEIGIKKYKDNPAFFLSLGHIEEQRGNVKGAAEHAYKLGLTSCKANVDLWISLAKLREKTASIPIARSTLEKARRFNDKVASLYIESAKLEIRAFLNSIKGTSGINRRPNLAESLISEGIRKCKGQPEIVQLESMQKSIKERKYHQCL